MVSDTLFSSDKMDWGTPQAFFDLLDREFHFTLDACATAQNAKCPNYITPEQNALETDWLGIVWCNPPYGRNIQSWIVHGWVASQVGNATVVILIPSRTDTHYWHEYVMHAAEIRFVRGRLRFEGADNSAPFPSAVIVFRPGHNGVPIVSSIDRA